MASTYSRNQPPTNRANARQRPLPRAARDTPYREPTLTRIERSLDNEQTTLGAMLMDRSAIAIVRRYLKSDDFGYELHKKIFDAICTCADNNTLYDFSIVAEELHRRGQLEEIGNAGYLSALIESCPSAANVEAYANVVLEYAMAKRCSDIGATMRTRLQYIDYAEGARQSIIMVVEDVMARIGAEHERFVSASAGSARYSDDTALDALVSDVSWMWPGWLPRGSLTLLCGRPGVGKSTVALDLCKRLITHSELSGGEWPDGAPIEDADTVFDEGQQLDSPLKLLWLDTESALGIFRSRLRDWEIPRGHFILPEGRELQPLRVDDDRDWSWIRGAVKDNAPPLVVLDSLSYAHGGDENSNDYMKFVMRRLSDLAAEFNTAVLAIHHLNKLPAGFPDWPITLDMIRGASAISQFPRSIIGLGHPAKEDPRKCGCMSVKLNIAAAPSDIGYETTEFGPVWGEVPVSTLDVMGAKEKAVAFLLEYLAGGPKFASEVFSAAEARGIKERTLNTAKGNLIETYKNINKWVWRLRDRSLEDTPPLEHLSVA